MASKLSKMGKIIPDRRAYGVDRATLDPLLDDAMEVPFKSMPEGKATDSLRKGFTTIKLPEHKPAVHSTASMGSDRVGAAWKHPTRGK